MSHEFRLREDFLLAMKAINVRPQTLNAKTDMRSLRRFCKQLSHFIDPTRLQSREDPLDCLIATILSQHTSDINSGRAFIRLKQAFPTWEQARQASPREIEAAIACGGLAKIKSQRIKQVLTKLTHKESGELNVDLEFLRAMSIPEARAFLCALPGVGLKTASCVLLFALGRPVCPVDTHVLRVAQRAGLIEPNMNADKATLALEAITPDDCMLVLHLGLIYVGRTTCRPRQPNCPECIINDMCEYARMHFVPKELAGSRAKR